MLYFSRWKATLIFLTMVFGVTFTLPNLLSPSALRALPGWLQNQIVLGLDLQGGAHLLLEVDIEPMLAQLLEGKLNDVRTALRSERIGYTGLGVRGTVISFSLRDSEQMADAVQVLEDLAEPVSNALLTASVGDDLEVVQIDGGRLEVRFSEAWKQQKTRSALSQSVEVIRRRIDELGTTEPTIQRQGKERILLQVPGGDPQKVKAIVGKTAKLTFHLVHPSVSAYQTSTDTLPAGYMVLESSPQPGFEADRLLVQRDVMVSGENLVDAQPGFDQNNQPSVNIRFDSVGARQFGRATQDNVGRLFAIVLDNKVISYPRINEPILGGNAQITGSFNVEGANDLSILLRAGALPADIRIIEERSVGPSLGADSVAAGKMAAVIGFVAVIVFMALSYGLFGLFANIALIINMTLIFGVLSVLQATLTLPGIAGIVLTIGMAVDANVLIFERIREETRAGKVVVKAIDAGYSRALGTILDANITTFIAAIVLFWLGSGPIKGFALTLAIGILTSVFTAFTMTRLLVSLWYARRRPETITL